MAKVVWPLQNDSPTTLSPVEDSVPDLEDGQGDGEAPRKTAVYQDRRTDAPVIGTTQLLEKGQLRFIPTPTPDPKDPLNLPEWRKYIAITAISLFGSLALGTQIVIGALLPVFLLEYSGVDPHLLTGVDFKTLSGGDDVRVNLLDILPSGTQTVDLTQLALLTTVPLLTNAIASYVLVPLSIAVGRRPVLLFASACTWAGGIWAGLSNSLTMHLAARVLQGVGVGAVEAVVPLVVQDLMFIHRRNTAMSVIFLSQGLVIAALGVAAPYIAANYTWRWIYFITSGAGFLAWLVMVGFAPETRWRRSKEELAGQSLWPLGPRTNRTELDHQTHARRTLWTSIGVFHFGMEWRNAARSILGTILCAFFPAVLWSVLVNCIFIVANQATGQITPSALLAQGLPFQYTGVAFVPFSLSAVVVFVLNGPVADRASNTISRRNGGVREPEHHLPNLALPFAAGIAGAFLYGAAAQNNLHWTVLLAGSFLLVFALLAAQTAVNVYVVESYPALAGPALVNVSSPRLIVAFVVSTPAAALVAERGLLATFAVYAEVMIVVALGLPALWFGGKQVRRWTAGTARLVKVRRAGVGDDGDAESEVST